MAEKNSKRVQQLREDLKATLERVRGAIRMRVPPRDQGYFLDALDQVQAFVLGQSRDPNMIQASLQGSKDATRRVLRSRPVDMIQVLNEIGGIEEELQDLLAEIF